MPAHSLPAARRRRGWDAGRAAAGRRRPRSRSGGRGSRWVVSRGGSRIRRRLLLRGRIGGLSRRLWARRGPGGRGRSGIVRGAGGGGWLRRSRCRRSRPRPRRFSAGSRVAGRMRLVIVRHEVVVRASDPLVVVFAADRRAEVAQAVPQRAGDLRQPLRTEHEERDNEDEQQVGGLQDVGDHLPQRVAVRGPRPRPSASAVMSAEGRRGRRCADDRRRGRRCAGYWPERRGNRPSAGRRSGTSRSGGRQHPRHRTCRWW